MTIAGSSQRRSTRRAPLANKTRHLHWANRSEWNALGAVNLRADFTRPRDETKANQRYTILTNAWFYVCERSGASSLPKTSFLSRVGLSSNASRKLLIFSIWLIERKKKLRNDRYPWWTSPDRRNSAWLSDGVAQWAYARLISQRPQICTVSFNLCKFCWKITQNVVSVQISKLA